MYCSDDEVYTELNRITYTSSGSSKIYVCMVALKRKE